MQRLLCGLFACLLTVGSYEAAAQSREIILNYVDPPGTLLALAIVPQADQIPSWMRETTLSGTKTGIGQFALAPKSAAGGAEPSTLYLFSSKQSTTDGPREPLKLDPGFGRAVEIQQTNDPLVELPQCEPSIEQQASCRVSDLTGDVLAVAVRGADNPSGGLGTLLASRGLVTDSWAAKRVIVSLNAENALQHIDFVGIVRGKDEKLVAPDATSVFVVRLNSNGIFSIVERSQDGDVDVDSIKFVGEK
jgi:hypothetical protein